MGTYMCDYNEQPMLNSEEQKKEVVFLIMLGVALTVLLGIEGAALTYLFKFI